MLRLLDLSDLMEMSREDVLSASVDIDPTKAEHQRNPPAYLIWLRHALKAITEDLPRSARYQARDASQRMLDVIEQTPPVGRGVAFYAAPDLWRSYVLPVPLPNRVRYGRPDVLPVLWAIDEYEPHAILAVDREHARIIQAYLGRSVVVEKQALWLNTWQWRFAMGRPTTSTRKVGIGVGRGPQRDDFEDRVEDHVRRFFAGAAEATNRFLEESKIARLIIGGPEEAASGVRDHLPKASRDRLVGVVQLPGRAEPAEIQARTLPVALAEEGRRKAELVETLLGAAAAATPGGVVGLAHTLEALQAQQAQIVVVDRDLETAVWRCQRCGYAMAEAADACPVCGGGVERLTVPEVLPILVRRNRARIELVTREASARLPGRIGALLRYVVREDVGADVDR